MINHSSTDSNVYQILSDQVEPERNELEEAVPADDSDDGSDN